MQVFMLDNALGHKLDHNWAHTTNKLVLKYCQILTWYPSFWLLCTKPKAKIRWNHQKATNKLVLKYCQILTWNLSFWLLCIKTKAKIKVESPKGYIPRNVFHLQFLLNLNAYHYTWQAWNFLGHHMAPSYHVPLNTCH